MSVHSPSLTSAQRALLDSLREDGIALAEAGQLLGEELWAEARADVEPFVVETFASPEPWFSKPSWNFGIAHGTANGGREAADGPRAHGPVPLHSPHPAAYAGAETARTSKATKAPRPFTIAPRR